MTAAVVDRAFVRIAHGLVHYRHAQGPGAHRPLYLAHAGPGSSLGLAPMVAELGSTRRVIAADMMGNGDSDPPPMAPTTLAFYVDCVVRTLDKLGIDTVDFYGSHSGASIGVELALQHPGRVGCLILDGLGLFPPALRDELSARYAPEVKPDEFGGHLAWAWHFVSGLSLHFPYYRPDPEHRLNVSAVPEPHLRQPMVTDLLKALATYHLAYRAVFAEDPAPRLPLLRHRTLVMAVHGDPLAVYVEEAAALVTGAQTALVAREQKIATVRAFLDSAG